MCYNTSDDPKWKSMRHWIEDERAIEKKNLDGDGVSITPKPDLDAKLSEDPTDHDIILDHLPDELFEDPPACDLDLPPDTYSKAAIICDSTLR